MSKTTGTASSLSELHAQTAMAAVGSTPKKDLSAELKLRKPEAEHLAASGQLDEAVELILAVEKQARLANDVATLKEACLTITRLSHDAKNWETLGRNITTISKRRAQRGMVVGAVVQLAMTYLDEMPDRKTKEELIVVLRAVSAGKIFAEKERAQLTQMLSQMKEADGNLAEACDILQEVHVETYGALTKLEKTEFILEQVRLLLAKKDFIRAHIVSKKILRKSFKEPGFEGVKIKFFKLMVEFWTQENNTFELYQAHFAIFDTKQFVPESEDPVAADGDAEMAAGDAGAAAEAAEAAHTAQWVSALKSAVVFCLLSAHSEEQASALAELGACAKLQDGALNHPDLAPFAAMVKHFSTPEICKWPMPDGCDEALRAHPAMAAGGVGGGHEEEWIEMMHKRLVEHNLRVIAGYYSSVRTSHLATLLGLTEAEVEERVSALVVADTIYARMDRPAGITSFRKQRPAEEVLDDWAGDISELLDLVGSTSRLISKELMVHKVA